MAVTLVTQTTIAFIWDFDKTLTPNYQQEPMFMKYGIQPKHFWDEVKRRQKDALSRGRDVQRDILPMNLILQYVREGIFKDLTNDRLREFGHDLEFVPGIPNFMQQTKDLIAANETYAKWGLKVEHYVVSTGIKPIIEGSRIGPYVTDVWANDFSDTVVPAGATTEELAAAKPGVINELIYPLDSNGKTRAVFEISKGSRKFDVDVNTKMTPDNRPIPINNMIYIADGPSDVPVFKIVRANGGRTYGVYAMTGNPAIDGEHFDSATLLEEQKRVDGIGEADFNPGTHSYRWLTKAMYKIADRMVIEREAALREMSTAPAHAQTPLVLNLEPSLPSGPAIN